MSTALSDAAPARPVLVLDSDPTMLARQRAAVVDVRETIGLWRLCWMLAWLDIRLRYRGSMLGPFWLTLSTALMVVAMGLVYSVLFGLKLHDYMPFLALSLVLWAFLQTLVVEACGTYTAVESMIRAQRMPYMLHAARVVLRNLLVFLHNIVVVVAVDLVLWSWPGEVAWMALPALVVWIIDAVAVTLLLGALCARFRDIPPIVGSIMQMAFFVSAVIWKPAQLRDHEWLLAFNPFYTLLEVVRGPLAGTLPSWEVYLSAGIFSVGLCAAGWLLFARVRGRLAYWL